MTHIRDRELKTYDAALQSLLPDSGNFAVIKGDDVVGKFDTYEDALKAGLEKFGLATFMVKRIESQDDSLYFQRACI